ncbi:MAG: hypothetical protein AB7F86_16225 [Bdellovibrionales bacterium]
MKPRVLPLLVLMAASLLLGCSNDKKKNEAELNKCLMDPTGQCPRGIVAASMANPHIVAPAVQQALKSGTNLSTIGSGGLPGAIQISSLDQEKLKGELKKGGYDTSSLGGSAPKLQDKPVISGGAEETTPRGPASTGGGGGDVIR